MRKSRPTEPEPTFAADEVAVAARAQNTVQNIPIGYDGQMTAVDPRVFLVGGAGLQVHRQLAAVCLAHGIALADLRMKSQRFLSAAPSAAMGSATLRARRDAAFAIVAQEWKLPCDKVHFGHSHAHLSPPALSMIRLFGS